MQNKGKIRKQMGMKGNQTERGKKFLKNKQTPSPHQKTCIRENDTSDCSWESVDAGMESYSVDTIMDI